jgi:hypothetical protein
MESKNRNVWIILAVIVVVLCCCVLAVAAAGAWFTTQSLDWTGATRLQRSEEAFAVGETPSLAIDNFAGNVTVRSGESGLIQVVATKNARRESDLARIEVQMSEQDGGLLIKTNKPSSLNSASVDLEITAPAGTVLDANTGAGDIDVRVAAGTARLDTGAGSLRYQGMPQGECRFETGAGDITLALPTDLNVRVDLETGTGDIDVDFVVDGEVTRREVQGVIGSGAEGTIYAHTGAGNIDVVRR